MNQVESRSNPVVENGHYLVSATENRTFASGVLTRVSLNVRIEAQEGRCIFLASHTPSGLCVVQSGPVLDGMIRDVLFVNLSDQEISVRRGDTLMVAFVALVEWVDRSSSAQTSEFFSAHDQASDRDERYDEHTYLYLPELQSQSSNRVDIFAQADSERLVLEASS